MFGNLLVGSTLFFHQYPFCKRHVIGEIEVDSNDNFNDLKRKQKRYVRSTVHARLTK
jgi:hypothetical protein